MLNTRVHMKNYDIAHIKLIIKENSYHYIFSVLISRKETRILLLKGNSYRSLSFNTNPVGLLHISWQTMYVNERKITADRLNFFLWKNKFFLFLFIFMTKSKAFICRFNAIDRNKSSTALKIKLEWTISFSNQIKLRKY